jgi:demethylmenaquinone methyltransferase/2-methoxy-6-polyprenyl-1,4-benzoquinol methylase
MNDKKHWYDGRIYDKFIAPNQDKMFVQIKNLIPENSNILDVGCGTGRLAFHLSEHCKKIVGVDVSSENISVANANLISKKINNIKFVQGDITKLKNIENDKFDYAVITYVIHEMDKNERIKVLLHVKSIANQIIIGDYITPTPNTFWGKVNFVVEFLAGKDHFNNFKNYVKNGGINYLADQTGLKKIKEIKNRPQTSHLVVLQ